MRMSRQAGGTDIDALEQLRTAKCNFEQRLQGLGAELQRYWKEWDALPEGATQEQRKPVLGRMLDLLNRRSYIRNLLRDVSAALV
jgi:molecular chaperone HscB